MALTNRNVQFDLLKTMAILQVCYCHYGTLYVDSTDLSVKGILKILIRLFACTAVPVFFMVNGALTLNRDYCLSEILKKAATLFRKIAIFVPLTALGYAYLHDQEILTIKELLYRSYNWQGNGVQHLWFLFSMLTIYLLYPAINLIYKERGGKNLYIILIFVLTFGNSGINLLYNLICYLGNIQADFIYDRDFFNGINFLHGWYSWVIVYYMLGAKMVKRQYNRKSVIGALLVLIGCSVFYVWMCNSMAIYTGDKAYMVYFWGYNQIYMLLIVSSIFVLSSKLIPIIHCRFVEHVLSITGSCTLGVLFFHRFYGEIIRNAFLKYGVDTRTTSLFWGVGSAGMVFLCSLLSTMLLKKLRIGKWLF